MKKKLLVFLIMLIIIIYNSFNTFAEYVDFTYEDYISHVEEGFIDNKEISYEELYIINKILEKKDYRSKGYEYNFTYQDFLNGIKDGLIEEITYEELYNSNLEGIKNLKIQESLEAYNFLRYGTIYGDLNRYNPIWSDNPIYYTNFFKIIIVFITLIFIFIINFRNKKS